MSSRYSFSNSSRVSFELFQTLLSMAFNSFFFFCKICLDVSPAAPAQAIPSDSISTKTTPSTENSILVYTDCSLATLTYDRFWFYECFCLLPTLVWSVLLPITFPEKYFVISSLSRDSLGDVFQIQAAKKFSVIFVIYFWYLGSHSYHVDL